LRATIPPKAAWEAHRGQDVQAVHLVLTSSIRAVEVPCGAEPCVIHQQFEILRRGDALFHSIQSLVRRQIGRENFHIDGMRLPQRISELLEPILASSHEQEIVALRRELFGKHGADAAGGASD
jgi:hypothetical protein